MLMMIKMFEHELKNLIAGQMRCRPEDVIFSVEEGQLGDTVITATIQQIIQPKEEANNEANENPEEE